MKSFRLESGEEVLVDDEDFDRVSQCHWHKVKSGNHGFYLATHIRSASGKRETVLIQRLILGLEVGDRRQGDHKDGNKLDNRKENLRILTPSQNQRAYRAKPAGCSSRFRGVSLCNKTGRWTAKVKIRANSKGVAKWFGFHDDEIAAARAFNDGAASLGFLPEALNQL
jgi:hypothetical protein